MDQKDNQELRRKIMGAMSESAAKQGLFILGRGVPHAEVRIWVPPAVNAMTLQAEHALNLMATYTGTPAAEVHTDWNAVLTPYEINLRAERKNYVDRKEAEQNKKDGTGNDKHSPPDGPGEGGALVSST